MTTPQTTSKTFEGSGYNLDTYLQYRIIYEPSFYDKIYAYHTSHNGEWNLAHDVGTGPTIAAQALSTRLKNVVASDINANQIETARQRLANSHPNVHLEHCRAEDTARLASEESYGKADLVAVAEVISLLNVEEALAAFAEVLKPGGTLAIWFYGQLIFADEGREKCQELYNRIVAKACQKMGSFAQNPVMRKSCNTLAAWLDDIAIPPKDWCDVKRLKWNYDRPLGFLNDEDLGFRTAWKSKIADNEVVEEKFDRDFWAREGCDIDWLKGFVGNMLPWPPSADIDAELEVLFGELGEVMGGKGAKAKVCWPVILMLASRR